MRKAQVNRKTKETDISVKLNLDGRGEASVDTQIAFFNHMLTLFARHGLFDLTLKAVGDFYGVARAIVPRRWLVTVGVI